MAGPLLLLASPLAIVAYYMLASALTSYIAYRVIRTWGLVGRLMATLSRKEHLPIAQAASSAPVPVEPSSTERARISYVVAWTATLLARLKLPKPKFPHLPYKRIELSPLSEEEVDEGVKLEEARLTIKEAKEPAPLVDLSETMSPMLGVFHGSSNVSACATPELRFHRHLPSPVPWRPGTTPPFTSSSSRFSTDESPKPPMTPPLTHNPLSPFASPKQLQKGKERESFEMRTLSQPLIQFSPVAPVPRVLFPHEKPRTPSPVYNNPRFLSTTPTFPSRPRRAVSLGGAAVKKVPSLEFGGKQKLGTFESGWERGRSGLLFDLGLPDDDVGPAFAAAPVGHFEAPTTITPQSGAPSCLDLGVKGEGGTVVHDIANEAPEETLLPASVVADRDCNDDLPQDDGEFGLFDNPFYTDPQRLVTVDTRPSPKTAFLVDWELDIGKTDSPSDLDSTPVVVSYPDAIPAPQISVPEGSPTQGVALEPLQEEQAPCPSPCKASIALEQVNPSPPSEVLHLEDLKEDLLEEAFPDPDDLPLPPDHCISQRFPDPELIDLPAVVSHEMASAVLLLLVYGQPPIVRHKAEDAVPNSPRAAVPASIATPGDDSDEMTPAASPLPGDTPPEPEAAAGEDAPTIANLASEHRDTVMAQTTAELSTNDDCSEVIQSLTEGTSQEPMVPEALSDKDKGGPTVDKSVPYSLPLSIPDAPPLKPRRRALSGGFSDVIIQTFQMRKASPLDVALAMQMRPGLGVGADPAFMVRFLMAAFGWFVIVVNGGID